MFFEITKSFVLFWLNFYERVRKPDGWDRKADIVRVVEFSFNILTLCIVVLEFMILSKKSAVGIYFIEKSIKSVANIYSCLSNFLESRRLLSKVDRFPDANPEEIHQANDKCIFCLDHLTHAKRINCGHLFHYKCLRDYFQASSNPLCPTCRADIDVKYVAPQPRAPEFVAQTITSSLIVQDLPEGFPLGSPLEIGAVAWGLPQAVNSHRISRHNEQMRKAVEGLNGFMVRFYKHPPDEVENDLVQQEEEKKENEPRRIRRLIPEDILRKLEKNYKYD